MNLSSLIVNKLKSGLVSFVIIDSDILMSRSRSPFILLLHVKGDECDALLQNIHLDKLILITLFDNLNSFVVFISIFIKIKIHTKHPQSPRKNEIKKK
jgi:hypothetical protein